MSTGTTFFFFNDTATTEIYTLSLHDALPIFNEETDGPPCSPASMQATRRCPSRDRKSTRLNSSHQIISYAVFCLKKKKGHLRAQPGEELSSPRWFAALTTPRLWDNSQCFRQR